MNRRKFLAGTGLAAAGAAGAAASAIPTPAISQNRRRLTMVTSWGRGLAGVHDAAQRCADNIVAMSDGMIEIDFKAAGELVGAFECFDAVSSRSGPTSITPPTTTSWGSTPPLPSTPPFPSA